MGDAWLPLHDYMREWAVARVEELIVDHPELARHRKRLVEQLANLGELASLRRVVAERDAAAERSGQALQ